MSWDNKEVWLECAWDSFYWCVYEGDYSGARAVIADTKDVDTKAAEYMQEYLNNAPVKSFLTPSPFHI